MSTRKLVPLTASFCHRASQSRVGHVAHRGIARAATVLLIFLPGTTGALWAQATGGSISGTVTREAGGSMPGVRVSVSDVAKTVSREATTDTDGVYNFPALPPAVYELTLSAHAFTTQVWTAIIVGVGTERVINIVMQPGDPKKVVRTAAPPAPIS